MACPPEAALRELAGGAPPPALVEHLKGCPDCASKLSRAGEGTRFREPTPPVPSPSTAGFGPPLAPAPALNRGETLGRYVVLDKLGQGGMAVVYGAYDKELDRRVALKLLAVIPREDRSQTEGYARLQREAQSMARLSHPNVVAVHDVLAMGDRVALVMEYVEGANLRAWLKERKRSWREVLRTFVAAGQGLAAAHEKGIVHRDFKPDNVLVAKDGRVRVADFGIARPSGEEPGAQTLSHHALNEPMGDELSQQPRHYAALTAAGQIIGTPAYMAPEQILEARADARTDQFSFAVSLYEALAGHRPFSGATLAERAEQIQRAAILPPPPGARVPRWLLKVTARALSARPEDRYPNMEALLRALAADPAVKLRRASLVAGAALLLAGGGGLATRAAHQRAQLCTGAEAKLTGLWDPPARERLRAAFLASGAPFSQDAFALADQGLTAYAAGWTAAHREACLATRVRGEQSDQALSLRMACLEAKRKQLAAVVDVLGKADARSAERTPKILGELSRLEECADLQLLLAEVKPPASPAARAKAEALGATLAEARVLRAAARYPEAFAVAERVFEQAKEIPYVPLQAEAKMLRANLLADTNQSSEQEAHQALELAESVGADRVAAGAGIRLTLNSAQPRPDQARHWANFTRAKLQRMGGNPELDGAYHVALGWLQGLGEGDPRAALQTFEAGLRRAEATLGPRHNTTLVLLDNYAETLLSVGEFKRAGEELQRLTTTARAVMGAHSPFLAYPLAGLAQVRFLQGEDAQTAALLEEAMALQERVGVDTWSLGQLFAQSAELARAQGDLASAISRYARTAQIADYTFKPTGREALQANAVLWGVRAESGERSAALRELRRLEAGAQALGDHQALAVVWLELGEALTRAGGLAEAEALVGKALASMKARPFDERITLQARLAEGRVLLALGRPEQALAELEQARAVLEHVGGASNPRLAVPLALEGRALAALGKPEQARADLERALTLAAPRAGAWQERAEAKLALAKLLTAEPERARQLTEEARAELAALGRVR